MSPRATAPMSRRPPPAMPATMHGPRPASRVGPSASRQPSRTTHVPAPRGRPARRRRPRLRRVGRDLARRRVRRTVLARGTAVRLTDLDGDACANVLLLNARPGRAAQRRRHGEGAVAGLPRRGVAAAVRHGPGAACRSSPTRGSATTRSAARRTRRATRRLRRGGAHGASPTPATGSRWRWPSTGSTAATSRRTSTCSRACGVDDGRHVALRRHADRAPARYVELLAELPVILVVANTPHVLDPRARLRGPPRCASPRGPDADRRAPMPAWSSTPGGGAGLPEHRGSPRWIMTSAPSDARSTSSTRSSARAPWAIVVDAARRCASSTCAGNQAVDCLLYNADDPTSATARRTRSPRRATSSSSTGTGSSRTRAAR